MRLHVIATALILYICAAVSATQLVTPKFKIETIAGAGQAGYAGDGGQATKALLDNPFGVARGPDGALYFCELTNHTIRRIDRNGVITTVAGTGKKGYAGDGGPAVKAELNDPHEVRFDKQGNLFFVEPLNNAVRRIDAKTKIITTVAGTGAAGFAGDGGAANQATLNQPISVQFDRRGDLYICDIRNHRIRKVDMKTGVIMTLAGTGEKKPTPDGARFSEAPLNGPRSMDFDSKGDMWLALREGNAVYRLDLKAGTIHHVAGSGQSGFTGNGGPAKLATLSGPKGISIAPNGDVYLADTESHSIRMIDARKLTIELIAGTGEKGDSNSSCEDGDPLRCKLARPHGVMVERDGSIFIGDSETHRVRVIRIGTASSSERSSINKPIR